LIRNVLKRGFFEDICRICAHFGLETAEKYVPEYDTIHYDGKVFPWLGNMAPWPNKSLRRKMENIRTGFARATA
jgi:hypothetical protein